jgi:hypothetical protein
MVYGTGKRRPILWSAVLALASAGVGCANTTDPDSRRGEMRVSEEVYRIFCKRIAAGAYQNDDTGTRFSAPCEVGETALNAGMADNRFVAMVRRRPQLVAALDQVFGDAQIASVTEAFATGAGDSGELDQFLKNLIPFYDDGTLKAGTDAISAMAGQLATPTDARASAVLAKLADLSRRQGYRAADQVLAATRPMLSYKRLDELSETLLTLLGEGGKGNAVFKQVLEATALELADDSKNVPNDQSTLRVATNLLMRTLRTPGEQKPADADANWTPSVFAETKAGAPRYFVRRTEEGVAIGAGNGITPFAVPGQADATPRGADGLAQGVTYGNATQTVLAGLLREQVPLLKRKADGEPSSIEKLLRGVRPLLGAQGDRTYTFTSGRQYAFKGPSVTDSPVLDLIHAVGALLTYPETEGVLVVLQELLTNYESDAGAPVYAGLAIDRDADQDMNAMLKGVDGTDASPSEFWDDLILVGQRILERPGMLEAVLRTFAEPTSAAQVQLLSKFMANKDQVTYNGSPLKVGSDGKYSAADATKLNSEIKTQIMTPVDRTQPDVGMNRSLFQRLVSMINATNGAPVCNKAGAHLTVAGPLGDLSFPNADQLQMLVAGCDADPTHTGSSYGACKFISQSNAAVTQMLAILDKGDNRPNDKQLKCAAAFNNQDIGKTQAESGQVEGFTLKPTAASLGRFIMAPRNKFLSDLFDPLLTKHGVPLVAFEPDMLFALEPKQSDVLLNGKPTNFLEVSRDLLKAFDDHEVVVDDKTTFDQPKWPKGYMFAELMSTLHMHWPSPRPDDCPATVQPGNEGCSQHLDPSKPFYAPQSNLVSYEPLLIRAFQEHKLGDILQKATARLKSINVLTDKTAGTATLVPAGTAGAQDGIGVLTSFLQLVLTPDEKLAYRDGRKYTVTNTCVPATDPTTGQPDCQADAAGVKRGRYLPQTTPLYMLLDALNGIDKVWATADKARYSDYLKARSDLVDQLLTVDRDDTDPASPVYRMHSQRGRAVTLEALSWLRGTVLQNHPIAGDRVAWAIGDNGLAKRLGETLRHPLVAYGLDLIDIVLSDVAASAEFAKLNAELVDFESNESNFLGMALAAADGLEFVDHEPNVAPVVQFGAIAIAPNAFKAIAPNGPAPNIAEGAAYKNLELTRKIAMLDAYRGKPTLSPIAKILKNAVAAPAGARSPLEVVFDAIADVNRVNPEKPTTEPFVAADNQKVFGNLQSFMSDPDRGLVRLYTVISGRDLNKKAGSK